ncbi:hypothetical protein OGATHE_004617 [Ogataea polymorpha]|uniref:Uncharacterized protein n=1 Tax=Ogataea polymorpha TaxID=460523 RepID=A0A9P8P146_9ASCO|nr:hypothetical protein OGATHE_004617 [Ogataea polymorpha]
MLNSSLRSARNCLVSRSLLRSNVAGRSSDEDLLVESAVARLRRRNSIFIVEGFFDKLLGREDALDDRRVDFPLISGSEYFRTCLGCAGISEDPAMFKSIFFRALGRWFIRCLSR